MDGVDRGCKVPPPGWFCTRAPGHDGPCAALPTPVDQNPEGGDVFGSVHAGHGAGTAGAKPFDFRHNPMTTQSTTGLVEARYLLMKRGLYYRPNNCGYTGFKERAGRYLESEASPGCGVTAIHEDEAAEIAPNCFDDLAREYLSGKIADRATTIAELVAALEESRRAMRDMIVGIGVHNDRAIDRHVPIEGPVISALIDAERQAETALTKARSDQHD